MSDFLNYQPASRPLVIDGKTIATLRGLGVDDLTYIINLHREDVIEAALAYSRQKASLFSTRGLEQMTTTLMTRFPKIVSEVISCAAGHRSAEGAAVAEKVPFGSQMTALADILTLTFDDAGGLKNLAAILADLAKQLLPDEVRVAVLESLKMTALSSASPASTGDAEKTRPS